MSSPEASSSSEDEFDLNAPAAPTAVPSTSTSSSASANANTNANASHAGLFSDDEDDDSADGKLTPTKTDRATASDADDDNGGEDQTKEKEMEDLFGSDYDSEEEEFKASGVKESPVREENRLAAQQELYAEDHGVSHGGSHSNEIWLPKTPKPSKSTTAFICKMPNILRLVPEAFTKQAIEEEMLNPSDEMLYRNYVRWRYQRDDQGKVKVDPVTRRPLRESNAKVVQWEDGSLTLFVGHEALNLSRQKIPNSFLFVNEVSSDKPQLDDEADAPGQETVLECHGRLKEKLTIRPTTTSSKSHKSLTMSMRAKHNKGVQKIKQYISELDGEREQEQRAKINDDRLRLQNRKKARQTFEDDRGRSSRMDASFLEEGYDGAADYDDADNVGAIKEQFGARNRSKGARRPAPPPRRPSASSFRGDGFDEYSRSRAREEERSDSEPEQAEDDEEDDEEEEEEEIMRSVKKRRTVDEEDSD